MMTDQTWVREFADALNEHQADVVPTLPRYVKSGDGAGVGNVVYDAQNRMIHYFEGDLGDQQRGKGVVYLPEGKGLSLRNGKRYENLEMQIRKSSGNTKRWEVYEVYFDGTDGRSPDEQDIDRAAQPTLSQIDSMRPQPTGGLSFKAPGTYYYTQPSTGIRRVVHDPTGSVATEVGLLSSGQHQAAVLYFSEETGAMGVATNTAVTAASTLPSSSSRNEFYDFTFTYVELPLYSIPLANVYLYYGQTTLAEADYYRLYDPRPLFQSAIPVPVTTVATKTANYTLTLTDYTILVDATGGAVTITLPPAADAYNSATGVGKVYNVKKIDSSGNVVTVDGDGSETIDGAANQAIATQWMSLSFQPDGVAWFII